MEGTAEIQVNGSVTINDDFIPFKAVMSEQYPKETSRKIKAVKIAARGTLSTLDVSPLKVAILKGLLAQSLDNVNYVNAPIYAKNRGDDNSETKSAQTCSYLGLLSVKVVTEEGFEKIQSDLSKSEFITNGSDLFVENLPKLEKQFR